MGEEHSRISK